MRAFNKSVFLVIIFVLGAYNIQAQREHRKHHKGSFQHLSQLNLTDDQKNGIKTIKDEHKKKIEALSEDAKIQDKKKIFEEQKQQILNILTEDQQTQWKEIAFKRAKGKKHREFKRRARLGSLKSKPDFEERKKNLSELRMSLEDQIADSDKLLIEEQRKEWKALTTHKKPSGKAKSKKEGKEDWVILKSKFKTLHTAVKPLVQKYKADIDELLDEHRETFNREIPKEKIQARRRHHRKHRISSISFLLMDVDNDNPNDKKSELDLTKLTLSPNPSDGQVRISFRTFASGNVKIELRNEGGAVVQTLYDEFTSEGKHTVTPELSYDSNMTYYITLTDKDGTQSQPLIIVR